MSLSIASRIFWPDSQCSVDDELSLTSGLVEWWSHAITDHLCAEAVLEALRMALRRRSVKPGLIIDSNQENQYIGHRVRTIMAARGIRQSMSSRGNGSENAMAESFFTALKKGRFVWQRFRTKEARQ
jgi:putative transposase